MNIDLSSGPYFDLAIRPSFDLSNNILPKITQNSSFYLNSNNDSNTSIQSDYSFFLEDGIEETVIDERSTSTLTISSSDSRRSSKELTHRLSSSSDSRRNSKELTLSRCGSSDGFFLNRTRSNQNISKYLTRKRRNRDQYVDLDKHIYTDTPTPPMFNSLKQYFDSKEEKN